MRQLKTKSALSIENKANGFSVSTGHVLETEGNIAEEVTAGQNALLKGILASVDEGVFSVDSNYRHTSFNKRHAEVMKELYGADVKIGGSLLDYQTNPTDRKLAKINIDKALKGELVIDENASGDEKFSRRWFEFRHCPFKNQKGEITGVAIFSRDITDRKNTEEALLAAEEKFRTIFENVNDVITYVDPHGKILDVNDRIEDLLGYKRDEIIGKNFIRLGLIQFRDVPKLLKLFTGTIRSGEAQKIVELELKHKNGSRVIVEVGTRFIRKRNGKIAGIVNIFRDVTERKQHEDALTESEAKYRELVDRLPEIVFEIDGKANIVFVNEKASELTGYSKEELTHHFNVSCLLAPEDQERAKENINNLFTGVPTRNNEYTSIRKDGTRFPISLSSIPIIKEGKIVGARGIVVDITESKKAETTLRKSEERFSKTFKSSPIGLTMTRLSDGYFVDANEAVLKLFEFSRQEVINNKSVDLNIYTASDQRAQLTQILEEEGSIHNMEIALRTKSGKLLNVLISIEKINFDGQDHAISTFVDLTELKLLQEKIEQYSKGLEFTVAERTKELIEAQSRLLKSERLAAIGELAGMVGHDLRNPLTGIKNATYFIRKKHGATIGDGGNEMLVLIDKAVEHANNIVGDLLDYSREMKLELEEYSPKSLINYVMMSIKPSSKIKILDRTQSFPTIWVDANKMERVFVNLIKNAVEAMPDGGTLEIISRQNRENVELVFSDTGTGMSGDVIAKIFTPLFTTKAQGMGFGLAICKRIVEAHRGKITVESAPNKGTTFTITLPMEQETETEDESSLNNENF